MEPLLISYAQEITNSPIFLAVTGHLERTLHSAKEELSVATQDTLDKQKDLASEKAMAKLDKYSRQEVLDNDWLKREVMYKFMHCWNVLMIYVLNGS